MANGFMAIAATGVLVAGMAGTARASELCVSCTGPDAVYACDIEGASTAADPRLSLYCITELAKAGGHASCSIERAKAAPCQGEKKRLANPGGLPADIEAPAPAAAATAGETAPAKPADPLTVTKAPAPPLAGQPAVTEIPKTGASPKAVEETKTVEEPKTVEEMVKKGTETAGKELQNGGKAAGDAAQTAGSALSKAGKAVGDAAQKTWTCITSLFGSC